METILLAGNALNLWVFKTDKDEDKSENICFCLSTYNVYSFKIVVRTKVFTYIRFPLIFQIDRYSVPIFPSSQACKQKKKKKISRQNLISVEYKKWSYILNSLYVSTIRTPYFCKLFLDLFITFVFLFFLFWSKCQIHSCLAGVAVVCRLPFKLLLRVSLQKKWDSIPIRHFRDNFY